jgi:parvulin-like peptidyl-prolyl isomerase
MNKRERFPLRVNLLAAGAFCVLLAACRAENPGEKTSGPHPDDPQTQAAVILGIEGTAYTNADFFKYARLTVGKDAAELPAASLSRLYDDFVEKKILYKGAQDQGVVLGDDEKKAYLDKMRTALGEGGNALLSGADEDVLMETLLVEKSFYLLVKDINVEDKEIAEYYAQHKSDYVLPERIQVSQILLATEGEASEVREQLKDANEEEFRNVARARSAGPEAAKGGIMGVFSAGQLPPELEKVIFPLKEGEISRVVESTYGYHIFRLDKTFEARLVPYEESVASIRAKIQEAKGQEIKARHIQELKASMDWKSYAENLPFAYIRNH